MTKFQLHKIRDFVRREVAKSIDPLHDFDHLVRVIDNARLIVSILRVKRDIDIDLLEAACLLHDIHFTRFKPGVLNFFRESRLLKRVVPSLIGQFGLSEADRYLLEEAIYHHTFAFPFRRLNKKYSLYAQILQDADTLETFSRVRFLGLKTLRNKSRFYRFVSLLSGLAAKRFRKNKHRYLNLPEIICYLTEEDQV